MQTTLPNIFLLLVQNRKFFTCTTWKGALINKRIRFLAQILLNQSHPILGVKVSRYSANS